ncbi:hypothetical protein [Leifsonia xyli]|uniref:hypothetical protein n=1 Tax=Leifsonia xyli TaxID=1575 RepID=UPI001F3804BE|nr:hypothetical protein [Leifsonia xyli]
MASGVDPGYTVDHGSADPDGVSVLSYSPREREKTRRYWTPERLEQADEKAGVSDRDGIGQQLNATIVPLAEIDSLGVLFGRKDNQPWRCSANAVEAQNLSVISTAGHCVAEKPHVIDHLVFYAGYRGPHRLSAFWKL